MKNYLILICVLLSLNGYASEPLTLKISERHVLPASEISGLCWGKNADGKKSLIAVGDMDAILYFFEWNKGSKPKASGEIKLEALGTERGSQWESIYADQSGHLFILPESPEVIHVFDVKNPKNVTTFPLDLNAEWKKKLQWDVEANSQGEGILLLKNGHILVLKEKNPLKIIEFAPSSDARPVGYNVNLSLEQNGEFPRPKSGVKFVPVHFWALTGPQQKIFPDGSGLNVNHKGELFLLSDKGLSIGKIGTLDPKLENYEIKEAWKFPYDIKKPEGMVFDNEGRILIATDSKKKDQPNLFVLDPM